MSLALFYDTETTGLPHFKEPSEHPGQPHIVQIAASLVDLESKQVKQSIDLIIKPQGWEIPLEMTEIHGITNEFALSVGVSETMAMDIFHALWNSASVRIGYNESFDARIVRISQHRVGYTDDFLDKWKSAKSECVMRMANPIVGMGKFPKLIEAYRHFFGKDFDGQHSASSDVKATMEIYFKCCK